MIIYLLSSGSTFGNSVGGRKRGHAIKLTKPMFSLNKKELKTIGILNP